MKNFLAGLAVVVSVIALGISLSAVKQAPVVPPLGSVSQDHYAPESFLQTITVGGNVFATSSVGAATYTAASLMNTSLIQHTAASALTATLPASSTLTSFAPRAGDIRSIYLTPITTGITLAGGTGTDLDSASSTKFCVVGALCRLTFVRKTNTDFEVFLDTGL